MSRSRPTQRLSVASEDDGVRIAVFDHDLALVAEGTSALELDVVPGLYACRFEAGASVREQLVVVRPDAPGQVRQEAIHFASAAPLAHTRTDDPRQADAANRLSHERHVTLGDGGELFVFVRDLDRRGRSSPARGLTLHDAHGELLADLDERGARGGRSAPPWWGCTLAVAPGGYRLRSRAPGDAAVEQAVVVSEGWQTQVFLARPKGHARSRGRQANLAGASVLMARLGCGFDPERDDLRAAELARQGLRDRRMAVPRRALRTMADRKSENPMLAIYAAHLMIHEAEPDVGQLRTIARNLRRLVGDHPDLCALELWLTQRGARPPRSSPHAFDAPPMLKSSWSIVVGASAEWPQLVSRESPSAEIAARVLHAGPWLRWRPAPAAARETEAPAPVRREALAEALADVADALPSDEEATPPAAETSVEAGVIAYAQQLAAGSPDASVDAADIDAADIVHALKVPRVVAEDAAREVLARMSAMA